MSYKLTDFNKPVKTGFCARRGIILPHDAKKRIAIVTS